MLGSRGVRIQRKWVLPTKCHPKTADQQSYANGLKPKIIKPLVSQVALRIPRPEVTATKTGGSSINSHSSEASEAKGP
jgi:hypothetical protein